jgi:1-acyl-sn-glycerol-3-phosphate acyltransferase
MRVTGIGDLPRHGPLLVVPNHDSQWDPVLVAIALRRRRKLRFLARANLWRIFALAPILNGLRQIPIERGAGDRQALDSAIEALGSGAAICVFPEGRLSRGERLRARSGVGRLASWCPGVRVVLCAITGTTDYVRFPRRPRVALRFFAPRDGGPRRDEDPAAMAARFLDEIRVLAPPVAAGRKPAPAPESEPS